MSQAPVRARARLTAPLILAKRQRGERIVMVTAYDAMFAALFDEAGVDIILVGDSLGMVIQGHSTTLPVTMNDMLYHCRAVTRGAQRCHLVADMPFMSYQVSLTDALYNAGRLLAEGGMHAVKVEGGQRSVEVISGLTRMGIPVMGHIGLTPQSVHALGGFRVQGTGPEGHDALLADARAVQEAGAYAVVLESLPSQLSKKITAALSIPTIGIGAGPDCNGQVLVGYDLLGLSSGPVPRFVKPYASFYADGIEATARFADEVRHGTFPGSEHCYACKETSPQPTTSVAHPDSGRD